MRVDRQASTPTLKGKGNGLGGITSRFGRVKQKARNYMFFLMGKFFIWYSAIVQIGRLRNHGSSLKLMLVLTLLSKYTFEFGLDIGRMLVSIER